MPNSANDVNLQNVGEKAIFNGIFNGNWNSDLTGLEDLFLHTFCTLVCRRFPIVNIHVHANRTTPFGACLNEFTLKMPLKITIQIVHSIRDVV